MTNTRGKLTVTGFIFLGSKITVGGDCSHKMKRCLLLGRKAMTNLDSILKSRDITLPTKVHIVKDMVFCSGQVWIWELDHRQSWAPKNLFFWIVVLEKTSEEIQPVNPKGNQSWIFIGRTDAEAEILWPSDAKSWLIWKRLWCWERLRAGWEGDDRRWDGWHHWLNEHEFEHLWAIVKDREACHAAVHGVTKSQIWLSDWTTTVTRVYLAVN